MGTLPSTLSDWSPQTGEAEAYSSQASMCPAYLHPSGRKRSMLSPTQANTSSYPQSASAFRALLLSVCICMHSWSARTGHMQIHVPVHGCKHAASHAWTHLCGHTCAGMYTSEHRSIQLHSALPQATGAWAGNDASVCLRAKGCLCGQAEEEGITTCVRKGGTTTYTYVHIATTCTTYTYTHVYIYTHTYIGNTYEHRLKAQHVTFETCMAELGCWPCLHVQMVSGPG